MSRISDTALKLGGFLLAHATWIIADLEPEDVYVPQALCLKNGELELLVFEAETQVEAVAKGKEFMRSYTSEFEACAFARDGMIRTGEDRIDVLTIDLSGEAGAHALTIIQPYTKSAIMHLLGQEALLTSEGVAVAEENAEVLRQSIRSGANDHAGALENWTALNSSRLPAPDLF